MTNTGPPWLGRVASRKDGDRFGITKKASNGFTAHDVMLPAAETRPDECPYTQLIKMSQGDACLMIGKHIQWADTRDDMFLSFSKCPMFLMAHALGRYHTGQWDTNIYFIEIRKATRLDGRPAGFIPTSTLVDEFGVLDFPGFQDTETRKRNHPRKSTQEHVVFGALGYKDETTRSALVSELIRDGLYEIFPTFEVDANHSRSGLYESQVAYRIAGFPAKPKDYPAVYSYENCSLPCDIDLYLLETVRKVDLNRVRIPAGADINTIQPPRPDRNPVFAGFIMPRYTRQDIEGLYQNADGNICPGVTHVADNLPSCMQYLDLLCGLIARAGTQPLPDNVVETQSVSHDPTLKHRNFTYKAYDTEQERTNRASRILDPEQYDPVAHEASKLEQRQKRLVKRLGITQVHSDSPSVIDVERVIAKVDEDNFVDRLTGSHGEYAKGSEISSGEEPRDDVGSEFGRDNLFRERNIDPEEEDIFAGYSITAERGWVDRLAEEVFSGHVDLAGNAKGQDMLPRGADERYDSGRKDDFSEVKHLPGDSG